MQRLWEDISTIKKKMKIRTAWRIEGTLREFPKFDPLNLWFDYPVHIMDETDVLSDIRTDEYNSKNSPYKKNFDNKKTNKQRENERKAALELAFESQQIDDKAKISDVMECLGKSEDTVRRYVKNHERYDIENGTIVKK